MRTPLAILALAALVAAPLPSTAAPGAVWVASLPATGAIDRLSAFADGTYYATFADGYARSRDHGKTWEPMASPRAGGSAAAVRFGTPTNGYAIASPGILAQLTDSEALGDELVRCGDMMPLVRTTNGGTSWRAVCVPFSRTQDTKPRFLVDSWQFAVGRDGQTVVLGGSDHYPGSEEKQCGEYSDTIVTTRDGGAHWNRFVFPVGWRGGIRTYVDGPLVVHLAYKFEQDHCESGHVGVWVSRDSGKTFRKTYDCLPPTCTAFTVVSRTRWLLGRANGTVLVSNDAGRTWRTGQRLFDARWQPAIDSGQMQPEYFWVQAFSFVGNVGYASTRGVGTWRSTDGGFSWRQEKSHECGWYQWGIGEVASGTVENAITGGPSAISSRVTTPEPTEGCAPPQQTPTSDLVAANGLLSLRLDGSLAR